MPTLLHLNGPPAIGKSTLAALWAERHPGTLNLDLDLVNTMIGGWRHDTRTLDLARPLGLAMAATHLAGGRDVVLPQLLARPAEVEKFEAVARDAGAQFREVVLLAGRSDALARFHARDAGSAWDRHNREVVASLGGEDSLHALYDRLQDVLAARPGAVVVASVPGQVEQTYAAVEAAVAG